ncbi:MAG: ATP synthase F1 subunit delta [Ignavibacteriae bacterium]|nr:ATP synthase F1 subunit delta [Ignavibacteriota bacterium]
MNEQRVSSRYARALLEIARQNGFTEIIYSDLKFVRHTIEQSRELKILTFSPVVQFWRKKKIYEEILTGKVQPLTMNFIILLTDKRRESLIPDICYQYEVQYYELNNILPIEIESAIELSEEIKNKITIKIEKNTNKKVISDFRINKSIKGGLLIKIQDWVFDASLKNQLEILFKKLSTD